MTVKQSFQSISRITDKPALFSLRLSFEERAMLDKIAGSRLLGDFIRARLFCEQVTQRKLHQRRAGVDHAALAKALALLGQSRIASNLNQLAKAAKL